MSTPYPKTLLRRTTAFLTAALALFVTTDIQAAKLTITGNPATMITITTAPVTPPPPPPVNCPTGYVQPTDMLQASLAGYGNVLLQKQKSGQVVSIPLPSTTTFHSGALSFGESAGGAY